MKLHSVEHFFMTLLMLRLCGLLHFLKDNVSLTDTASVLYLHYGRSLASGKRDSQIWDNDYLPIMHTYIHTYNGRYSQKKLWVARTDIKNLPWMFQTHPQFPWPPPSNPTIAIPFTALTESTDLFSKISGYLNFSRRSLWRQLSSRMWRHVVG